MAIYISVQYNCGLLPDMILLTQGYYPWGTRLNTIYRGFVFTAYGTVYYYYHVLHCFCFCCFSGVSAWRLIQAYSIITVGFSPTIILLTHVTTDHNNRGTRLNAMKRFCICSL